MKLNYYQFKTTNPKAIQALVKGMIDLAGESAVALCAGLVKSNAIYVNLCSPLPMHTIRAVALAMAAAGVNGADIIYGSIELLRTTKQPLIQRKRRGKQSPTEPASGHSRFDPNQMSFPG